jgi:hypothetical protein
MLYLKPLLPGQQANIHQLSCRISAALANPISVGVEVIDQYYAFFGDESPPGLLPVGGNCDITLSQNQRIAAQFVNVAGTETLEIFAHGHKRTRLKSCQ